MASLYKRKGSPFWWLQWVNPLTTRKEQFSTGFRIDSPRDKVAAVHLRHTYALKENVAPDGRKHPFAEWVNEYLQTSHASSPRTLVRYTGTWKLLACFLDSRKIYTPAQVSREVALAYLPWRSKMPHLGSRKLRKPVCRNTILLELKVFSKIMQEAVNRTYIEYNPVSRLELKRGASRPKKEMSDAEIKIIRAEIDRRRNKASTKLERLNAEFLHHSFEIARLQGIRLSETYIRMEDVDLERRLVLVAGKGDKLEEVNLNPNLAPFFAQLKQSGATHSYLRPTIPSLVWFKLFDRIRQQHPGFKNISFHSTRVTVISRMERAGVPENVMMKTVLHSSTTTHRVYRKVKASELTPYWSVLGAPPAAADRPD